MLVEYFVGRYVKAAGKKIRHIGKQTLEQLTAYDWPGNIRELQNVVERAVILSETDTLFVDECWLKRESAEPRQPREGPSTLSDREVEMIEAALADCHGRISGSSGAAAKLGIPRQTLEIENQTFGNQQVRPETSILLIGTALASDERACHHIVLPKPLRNVSPSVASSLRFRHVLLSARHFAERAA